MNTELEAILARAYESELNIINANQYRINECVVTVGADVPVSLAEDTIFVRRDNTGHYEVLTRTRFYDQNFGFQRIYAHYATKRNNLKEFSAIERRLIECGAIEYLDQHQKELPKARIVRFNPRSYHGKRQLQYN